MSSPSLQGAAPLPLDVVSARLSPDLAERPWSRLAAFLGLERRGLAAVLIYAVVIGALTLATPIAVQALVNTIAFGSVLQPLVVLTLLLFVGLAFAGALTLLESYVTEVLQRRIFVRTATDFGSRVTRLRAESLDTRHAPELLNRFLEVVTIQKSLAGLLLDGLSLALQVVIGMILLAFYHPLLLAFVVVVVALFVAVLAAGRGAFAAGLAESAAKYRTVAWLQDVARATFSLRGTAARRSADERIELLCRDYLSARRLHFRVLMRQLAGGVMLQVFAVVALLGVGGWLVMDRQLTLGQLVAAELVVASMGAGFAKVGRNLEKVYDLAVGVAKLARVIDLPIETQGGASLPQDGPTSLTLRAVSIDRENRRVLDGAHMEVRPGERVRLVGHSGSGKSTVLDLLGGVRRPTAGSVQVDDVDLRHADLGSVRDAVVLVRSSDTIAGTVAENLHLDAARIDEPQLRGLLRVVALEAVVDALPAGLHTRITPTGAPLTESQVRRLAIARALAGQPRALLLDGALDGLALTTEQKARCLDFVLGPRAPWTAVVVTNDEDVAWHCGRTVRLADGRLEDVA